MKKLLLVLLLIGFMAGAAFADHPGDKWGVGLVGGWNFGTYSGLGGGGGLALKVPGIPIFWTIDASLYTYWFYMSVNSDFYFLNGAFAPTVHYFIGAGLFASIYSYSYWSHTTYFRFAVGGRIPIGVSWHIIDWFELFASVSPSVGVTFGNWYNDDYGALYWGIPLNIGFRFWF